MNDVRFEETAVSVLSRFKSFYGRVVDQMPVLLTSDRLPMTPRELLHERVHGANTHDRNVFLDNYVDTACAIITGSDGEVLVGLYTNPLVKNLIHGLCPERRMLEEGSLPVNADVYQEIKKDAFVIAPDAAHILRRRHYDEQAVREGFWNYVAQGDSKLVLDYVRVVSERIGGSMTDRMGLWLPQSSGLRLLCVASVCSIGHADGYCLLNHDDRRLVGVLQRAI